MLDKRFGFSYYVFVSNTEKALKGIKNWVDKIGETEARKRLSDRGMSVWTADRLVKGSYPSKPGAMITQILIEEMLKDGFSVGAEKAS